MNVRIASLFAVAVLASSSCKGDEGDSVASKLPPAATKVEPEPQEEATTPVQLAAQLSISPVVDDDPILRDLESVVGKDELARTLGIVVAQESRPSLGGAAPVSVAYLHAADRAALAGYLAALSQRHPEMAPAEGQGFAFEAAAIEGKPRWRSHLIDHAQGMKVSTAVSVTPETSDVGRSQVRVHFVPEDAEAFADLTEDRVGHKLAIVVGDRVVSAPLVRDPILGGVVVIVSSANDDGGRAEAERLVDELLGR
jgi:hypothetical protein